MVGDLRFSGESRADKLSATVCTSNPAIDAAINIGAREAQATNWVLAFFAFHTNYVNKPSIYAVYIKIIK